MKRGIRMIKFIRLNIVLLAIVTTIICAGYAVLFNISALFYPPFYLQVMATIGLWYCAKIYKKLTSEKLKHQN